MKTHTKRLALTAMLLGMLLTVFTVTTVMASTNGVTSGDQQRDRVHDCDQTCQNAGTCPNTCDGAGTQQQHQYGSTCGSGCTGDAIMQQVRSRYQYQNCMNQGS
jgi:hypothetical protein